jgi:hypothetical protein
MVLMRRNDRLATPTQEIQNKTKKKKKKKKYKTPNSIGL